MVSSLLSFSLSLPLSLSGAYTVTRVDACWLRWPPRSVLSSGERKVIESKGEGDVDGTSSSFLILIYRGFLIVRPKGREGNFSRPFVGEASKDRREAQVLRGVERA